MEELDDPKMSARWAGLRYVSDDSPGIKRERVGKAVRYRYASGEFVRDRNVLNRIKALAIPPAWTDVWICPDPRGHLQATGRDARRRKQHRYHPDWREVRDQTKYNRMILFARSLPKIRRRLRNDLKTQGLSRHKVLATVVSLLEESLIRVGNEEYARDNNSFGLTTMQNRHVDVKGSLMTFHFRGKGGKRHAVDVKDARLARIVRNCQDLPGQELFQYVDKEGKRQHVHSNDVNDYLREISEQDFSAKDFRTWAGTVLCASALSRFKPFQFQTRAKKNLTAAIETVANHLGNTPAICRKCYVHPEIMNSYLEGKLAEAIKEPAGRGVVKSIYKLRPEESAILSLLKQRARNSNDSNSLRSKLKDSISAARKSSKPHLL